MTPGEVSAAPVLLVSRNERLSRTVESTLARWNLDVRQVDELEALTQAEGGLGRVVVCEGFPRARIFAERLKAVGAVPIIIPSGRGFVQGDFPLVRNPRELVAAVFRAQGLAADIAPHALERVNRFAQVIATQFTIPELSRMAIAKTRELTEADGASLLLVSPETGELYFDTVAGDAEGKLERVQLPRGKGIAGRVALTATARLVPDVSTCAEFDASIDLKTGFHTGSVVAAPLVLAGDVLGVMMAVRSRSRPAFTPVHLEQLVHLAPHVAIAVHNAQMTAALRESQAQVMASNQSLEAKVVERTQQISRAKLEWERTFDAIAEPIALMDGFVIRRANASYAKRVGQRLQDLPGKTCFKLLAGRDAPCVGCPLALGHGASNSVEVEMHSKAEHRTTLLRASIHWMSESPDERSGVMHYQDVTQSRALQERLRESERLAAVGQLASGAAHEINNPLGFVTSNLRSLKGIVEELKTPVSTFGDAVGLAKEGRVAELMALLERAEVVDAQALIDGAEMIDESLDGARRVGDIVKGLRELSRLEIGRREPANVNASVSRAIRAEFGETADIVQLEFAAEGQADIPPLQLDQALGHIIKNARQAIAVGQKIHVRTWHTDQEVFVEVRDEGAGIHKENLRRVFEPFFTTRGIGKGIGLGLTAAYGIVKRVGGEIEAHSDGPAQGARFTLRLPKVEVAALAAA